MNNCRKPREKTRFREVPEKGEGESRRGAVRAGFQVPFSPSWGQSGSLSSSLSLTLGPSPPSQHTITLSRKGANQGQRKEGLGDCPAPGSASPSRILLPGFCTCCPRASISPLLGGRCTPGPLFKLGPGSTLRGQWAFLHLFCSSVLPDTKCLVNSCSAADFSHP